VFIVVSTALTDDQFLRWGWRVPFLLSALLIVVGMFIRLGIQETPAFVRLKQAGTDEEHPIRTVIRDCRKNVLLAIGMRVGENGLYYIFTVFVLTYGQVQLQLSRTTMLTGVSLAAFVGIFSNLFFASLSDKIGRRSVYLFGAAFSLVFSFPFFWLLNTQSTPIIWIAVIVGLNIGHDAMYGPQAAYFSELFDPSVRYTAVSLSGQLASVLAGALAPLIAFGLLTVGGSTAVATYMVVLSLITTLSTYYAPETYRNGVQFVQGGAEGSTSTP
jgi:MFS family permease